MSVSMLIAYTSSTSFSDIGYNSLPSVTCSPAAYMMSYFETSYKKKSHCIMLLVKIMQFKTFVSTCYCIAYKCFVRHSSVSIWFESFDHILFSKKIRKHKLIYRRKPIKCLIVKVSSANSNWNQQLGRR